MNRPRMTWTAPIDAYCERTSAALLAEPVNAASNLAFFAAAALAFLAWRRIGARRRRAGGAPDRAGLVFIALVAVIGAGSLLFHTVAEEWASLADVIPIALFIHAYLALALFRLVGVPWFVAGLGTLAFFAASFVVEPLFAPLIGSSAAYAPALLALWGIGGRLLWQDRPEGRLVAAAGLVFLASLAARTLDLPLCAAWPLGTHFVWHILNALTLGLLLLAAIRHGARPAKPRITA